MRKPLIAFVLIALIESSQLGVSSPVPRKSLLAQLNPNYLRAMAAYKRLEPKLTRADLRAITVIGILNGAQKTEEQMAEKLIEVVRDLIENINTNDQKIVLAKIEKIEKQIARDRRALEVLSNAMDLAAGSLSAKEFRKEMKEMLQEVRRKTVDTLMLTDALDQEVAYADKMSKKIVELRRSIKAQMDMMKQLVGDKIEKTLKHLIDEADEHGLIAEASEKIIRDKRNALMRNNETDMPAEVRIINSILSEADFRNNLVIDLPSGNRKEIKDINDSFEHEFELNNSTKKNIENRSDKMAAAKKNTRNNSNNIEDIIKAVVTNITATTNRTNERTRTRTRPAKQIIEPTVEVDIDEPARQEDDFPEDGPDENAGGGGGGGGLVGIITGLSGGEGGSDIGALIGALTGVISTLFGPGGLDVDSLIGTATSLISGLLAGDKNFGTVLGMYVGTALDGLSGGGGAINNGQFIGNLLGTIVASLSADPEEENAPIKPLIFAENFINSFLEAKNPKASAEASGERKGQSHPHGMKDDGFDSGGFVKSIVSHLVSTALSFVLNASLGAVGGASKASSSLVASSSHKSH